MDRIEPGDFRQTDAREKANQQAVAELLQFASSSFNQLDKDEDNVVTRQELAMARANPKLNAQKLAALERSFDTLSGFRPSDQQAGLTRAGLDEADRLLKHRQTTYTSAATIRDGLLYDFDRLDKNADKQLSYREIEAGRADRTGGRGTLAAIMAMDSIREIGRPMGALNGSKDDYVISREDLATYPSRVLRASDPRLDFLSRSVIGDTKVVANPSITVTPVLVSDNSLRVADKLPDYAGFVTAGAGAAAVRFLPRGAGATAGVGALYQSYRDADNLMGSRGTWRDGAALTADASIAAGATAYLMNATGRYKFALLAGGLAARVGLEIIAPGKK